MSDADVIVVGGGPGGAATAYHLARRGHNVILLDRRRFPRDKSCGDGLTRRAVRALARMHALDALDGARAVTGVAVHLKDRGCERMPYPDDEHGLVVPRVTLDAVLLGCARAQGAHVFEDATVTSLLRDERGVRGVIVRHTGGERAHLRAPVTVVAAGAGSRLADHPDARGAGRGFALRTYLRSMRSVPDELEIYLPITEVTDRYLLPSYGWLFPIDATTANFGIGLFETDHDVNARRLAERFLAKRRAADPRLTDVVADRWYGAPLRCDFAAQRCAEPGLIRVGDAAGLVSPFTGEGIGFAVESGELAADVIDRNASSGPEPLETGDYQVLMEREYAGYFEAGRRSVQRYRTLWHVLDDTFRRREPLFTIARQTLLYPEALDRSPLGRLLDDVTPLIARGLNVTAALLAADEVTYTTLRREWPFLARAWLGGGGTPTIPMRPALLTILCARLAGGRARSLAEDRPLAALAAAVELSMLALSCHASVSTGGPGVGATTARDVNWGDRFTVALGDFLLTRAYVLACEYGTHAAQRMAEALAAIMAAHLQESTMLGAVDVSAADRLALIAAESEATLGLACGLGGVHADDDEGSIQRLVAYGRALGTAHRLTDELLWYQGHEPSTAAAAAVDLSRGIYGVAVPIAAADPAARARLVAALHGPTPQVDEVRTVLHDSGALDRLESLARAHVERAHAALAPSRTGPARSSLERLAVWAHRRETGGHAVLSDALP